MRMVLRSSNTRCFAWRFSGLGGIPALRRISSPTTSDTYTHTYTHMPTQTQVHKHIHRHTHTHISFRVSMFHYSNALNLTHPRPPSYPHHVSHSYSNQRMPPSACPHSSPEGPAWFLSDVLQLLVLILIPSTSGHSSLSFVYLLIRPGDPHLNTRPSHMA